MKLAFKLCNEEYIITVVRYITPRSSGDWEEGRGSLIVIHGDWEEGRGTRRRVGVSDSYTWR